MKYTTVQMIKAIQEALEKERQRENNMGNICISFEIAENVLIPMLQEKTIDRDRPMKPKYKAGPDEYFCGNCGMNFKIWRPHSYCARCGQKIDIE